MEKIKSLKEHPRFKMLTDVRNIGLYAFGVLVLLVSYNAVKVIERNYQLQKKISTLEQKNEVQELENSNLNLRNTFLSTDQYLELTARKQFGKAAPGEIVTLVPEEVAKKYIVELPETAPQTTVIETIESEPFYERNPKAWWRFFFGE